MCSSDLRGEVPRVVVPIEAEGEEEQTALAVTKRETAARAREDFPTFCEYVMRDEETGEPITPARLEAVPWARTNVRGHRRSHAAREAP